MRKGSKKKEPFIWNSPDKWEYFEKMRAEMGAEAFDKLSDDEKEIEGVIGCLADILVDIFLEQEDKKKE